MKNLQHTRLRFLDEAGATTILTKLYARAVGGARTTEAVPRNYGTSTSMISTLGVGGAQATMLIEGSVDTVVFNAYCQEVLRPTLKAGDVIVPRQSGSASSEPHRRNHPELRGASYLAAAVLAGLFAD